MWTVSAFYFFTPVENLESVESEILEQCRQKGILGLFILAPEGLNSTCCAQDTARLAEFEEWLRTRFHQPNIFFKHSVSPVRPFQSAKVKIRSEIVTAGIPDLIPPERHPHSLSPAEWDAALKEPDTVVIDTRNDYEYRIGTFRGALDPNIEQFTDFPKYFESQNIEKHQKIMIFCTGGIRCEKGILELERRGYDNVYQLHGGILNYLKEFPEGEFKGECFVFDNRVAVDKNLAASTQYKLCPHCGGPAEVKKTCVRCDSPFQVCPSCAAMETCSKNCAHHWTLAPGKRGRPQIPLWQLQR